MNSRYFSIFSPFDFMLTRSTCFPWSVLACSRQPSAARGAPVHGGAAPWRSSRAAPTRRDDARCCAPPNASRAAQSRHQPAAPDAASARSSSSRPSASQRAPRGDLARNHKKITIKLPNFHARDPKNCKKITEFPA